MTSMTMTTIAAIAVLLIVASAGVINKRNNKDE